MKKFVEAISLLCLVKHLKYEVRAMQKLVLSLLTVVLIAVAFNTFGQEEVAAPVYKDGDSWVFRTKEENKAPEECRVTHKDGKFDSDCGNVFLTSPVWVTVHLNDPDRKWFDFPLTKGKKWRFKFSHTSDATRKFEWREAEAEVVGPMSQPVETPAGKVNVSEIRRTDRGRAWFTVVYFYSPETKSVVRLATDVESPVGKQRFEMELIKYSVSK